MNTKNLRQLVRLLSENPQVKFASFLYQTKETGAVSQYTVILGSSTENLYEKDIEVLEAIIPTFWGEKKEVAQELLDSKRESLDVGIGNNSRYTQAETWWYPKRLHGTGIRVHKENGSFQITALVHQRTTIDPGVKKPDTRRPRTKLKDEVRALLPSSRFRSLCLSNIAGIRCNGETIEFDNVIHANP